MWIFILLIVLFILIIFFVSGKKKRDEQEVLPPSNPADIQSRRKELSASAAIGLRNLSGFNVAVDHLCGIYLFRDKIYFESKGLYLEIPMGYFQRVYTETLTDNSFFRNYIPKLPQLSLKIPSAPKLDPEEEFIEEHRLVFEVKGKNNESEYLVFAFGNEQSQAVKRFVEHCDGFRNDAAIEKEQNAQ